GGIMGLGGTALVFWEDLIAFSLADEKLIGLFLAISGTYVASLGNITSARNQSKGIPVVSSNAYAMTYSGLTLLLIALISGKQISFLVQTPYIISLLYLAILGSVVAFGAYLTLIGKIGPGKASYVSLLVPIIAMIISTIFEDYQWSATSFSGAALILFGNGIAMYKPKPAS
ncbi:MAG: DMT family transporter, partial [Balneolales bacterium]|nr:DMT family transporter [Balneolales bacterium]